MKKITLIKGDGIGPEISDAVVRIIRASGADIEWDVQTAGTDVIEKEGVPLPQRVLHPPTNSASRMMLSLILNCIILEQTPLGVY